MRGCVRVAEWVSGCKGVGVGVAVSEREIDSVCV